VSHPGRAVYLNRCASCHGEIGEGKPTAVASVAPYRYVSTGGSLQNKNASWMSNRNEFGQIVVKGLTGRMMPGNATLTKQQVNDLFDYVHRFPENRLKSALRPGP
jgi:cytochrome c